MAQASPETTRPMRRSRPFAQQSAVSRLDLLLGVAARSRRLLRRGKIGHKEIDYER